MLKPTRVAALYLLLVFVAGALFGLVSHSLYTQRSTRAAPNPQEFRERYIEKLRQDLALSPDQVSQLTAILDETHDRFQELRDRMTPEFDAIRQNQRGRITALLNPEQQPRYQKILEQHQQAREKRGGPGRRGGR